MEPQTLVGQAVEVRDQEGHRSLVSKIRLGAGDCILTVLGDDVSSPSRYSIQVGKYEHVEPSVPPTDLETYDNYLWLLPKPRFFTELDDGWATIGGYD